MAVDDRVANIQHRAVVRSVRHDFDLRKAWALLPFVIGMVASPAAAERDYEVVFKALTLLPATKLSPPGAARTVRKGEVFAEIPVAIDEYGVLEQAIELEFAGADWIIPERAALYSVRTVTGGASTGFPQGARILCGQIYRRPNSLVDRIPEAEWKAIKARYEPAIRPCFIDSDGDEALDKAFIIGLKDAAARAAYGIPPVRYRMKRDVPLTGTSRMRLVYEDGDGILAPSLDMKMTINGQQIHYIRLAFTEPGMHSPRKAWAAFKSEGFPQQVAIADAVFSVYGVNREAKTATIALERPFGRAPFVFEEVLSLFSIDLPPEPAPAPPATTP